MTQLPEPRQILAVGRNYPAHAAELGNEPPPTPLLFWKPLGSLAPDRVCPLPTWPEGPTRIDFEGEVALVLGRDLGPGTPTLPGDPWDAVAGIAAACDVSDRDLQKLEPQWVRAKGFAGSCILGPVVPCTLDPTHLKLDTWHNDVHVQEGYTSQLLFPFRELLEYVHGFLRLFAGDVVLTGTPPGVGRLAPGDRLRVAISGRADDAPRLAELEARFVAGPTVAPFQGRLPAG